MEITSFWALDFKPAEFLSEFRQNLTLLFYYETSFFT